MWSESDVAEKETIEQRIIDCYCVVYSFLATRSLSAHEPHARSLFIVSFVDAQNNFIQIDGIMFAHNELIAWFIETKKKRRV